MSVLVVGLSHKSAPVAILERAVVERRHARPSCSRTCAPADTSPRPSSSPPATGSRSTPRWTGSTAASPRSASCSPGTPACRLDELTAHLYVHYEDRAVAHLLAVACGLDSMVVGEGQILGQVRPALELAAGARHRRPRAAASSAQHRAAGRQAGPRRDRHRPGRRSAWSAWPSSSPRRRAWARPPGTGDWPGATCSSSGPAR